MFKGLSGSPTRRDCARDSKRRTFDMQPPRFHLKLFTAVSSQVTFTRVRWGACFKLIIVIAFSIQGAWAASDPISYVDMNFPDGGTGRVFRGADIPFGMMMFGPSPQGYSLTFLSGAEMDSGFQMNLPILPTFGMPFPLTRLDNGIIHRAVDLDSGQPGYFWSWLKDGIFCELTATARTGMGRFTFPPSSQSKDSRFLFYLHTGDNNYLISKNNEIRGTIIRNSIKMYFVARFDRPFTGVGSWNSIFTHNGRLSDSNINGAYVRFDTSRNPVVLMKIGMSWVSEGNAALNLDTEIPGWDFDLIRARAQDEWNRKLGLIEVEGGTEAQSRMFYTHLSQTLLHPNLASDVNGEYLGFDYQIHRVPEGHPHYANYSGWDIYRTWVPLMSLLLPTELSDMMQSLVDDGLQGGGLPIWPVENLETGVMSGGSSTPILAGAYAFGARDFDFEKAFELMDRDESDPTARVQGFPERAHLAEFLKRGYVPFSISDTPSRVSVSTTLEYVTDEFALSRFAQSLGYADRAAYFQKLSRNWANLYNPETGYLQPRYADGSWEGPFDPDFGTLIDFFKRGYDEGNAHTWLLAVHHDLRRLFDLLGGNSRVNAILDAHFTKLNDGSTLWGGAELIPYVGKYSWIGNEPEFGSPWEYNWAGTPWKTQSLVRREINEQFMRWYVGDEDLGAMSAWAIWGALGLYPEIAGLGGLTVASPLFPLARVHLGSGKILEIRSSSEGPFIESLRVNSTPWDRAWIGIDELLRADEPTLAFDLGPQPNEFWGASPQNSPPSD